MTTRLHRPLAAVAAVLIAAAVWAQTPQQEVASIALEAEEGAGIREIAYPISFPEDFPTATLVVTISAEPHEAVLLSIDGAALGEFQGHDRLRMVVPIGPRTLTHRLRTVAFVASGGQGEVVDQLTDPVDLPISASPGRQYSVRLGAAPTDAVAPGVEVTTDTRSRGEAEVIEVEVSPNSGN